MSSAAARPRAAHPAAARLGPALLALLSGCAPAVTELRAHTYPPEFRYFDRATVSDAMFGFTRDLERIDEILRAHPRPTEAERADIRARLGRMESLAAALDDGVHPSNQPLIDARMGNFRRDLGLARAAVEASPPSYFLAGSVAGSCLHCHGARR